MPIYFRSDRRPPEEIFKDGFTPREDMEEDWWHEAIKARLYRDKRGINNEAIDADLRVAICLTSKFESAPLFPLEEGDTYVYAIALPDATKISYEKKQRDIYLLPNLPTDIELGQYTNSYIFTQTMPTKLIYVTPQGIKENLMIGGGSKDLEELQRVITSLNNDSNYSVPLQKKLDDSDSLELFWKTISINAGHSRFNVNLVKEKDTPTDVKDIIVDLHSLQTTQTGKIVKFFSKQKIEDESIAPYSGWPLYAYEAIAYQVKPENIICAIKVKREKLQNSEMFCYYINEKPIKSLERKFHVEKDIVTNKNFIDKQSLLVGNNNTKKTFDYSEEYHDAIETFKNAKTQKLETPSIPYGLGGKTF